MQKIRTSDEIDEPRRRFLAIAAGTIAALELGIETANAQMPRQLPAIKPGAHTSFSSLKQIDAGVLNMGYAEAGPSDGPLFFFCTAGPMISTATSMSRRCWPRRATGRSYPICAATAARAF